jgi:ABC-type molybdate transport system permease subunit
MPVTECDLADPETGQPDHRDPAGYRHPIAWWLARTLLAARAGGRVVALPLVLPPTVIGFYLLLALGPTAGSASYPGAGPGHVVFSFTGW